MPSLLDSYPLRVLIGGQDFTGLVDGGLTFSNVDPGGYEACSIPIPRDCPDLSDGMPIRIECGTQTAWEGRIGEIQRSLGNKTIVTGEGYGAELKENMLSEVYVDRDLTRWQQPTYARQAALVSADYQIASYQIGPDPVSNAPALVMQITDSWSSPWRPLAEAWYDAGPENLIAKVWYDVTFDTSYGTNANFYDDIDLSVDTNTSTSETTGNLWASPWTEVSGYFAPATAYRFAVIQHQYTATPAGVQGSQYNSYYHNLAAYGNHGLTGRGSNPVGFYPSDIVKHAISQLPSGPIVAGIIPDYTAYIVPHYVQYTPVPVEQIVADMAGLAGVHWGTWESLSPLTGNPTPRFDFRAYPTSATCFAYRQDCDSLDINEQLANLYDSAQVTFTDSAGVQQAVYVTLDNPYLDRAGVHRTMQIDAGTSTAAAAASFGQTALLLSQTQARASGSAVISGLVHTASGSIPAFLLKAGIDRMRIPDLPGQNAFAVPGILGGDGEFAISRVEASIGTDGLSTTVELGTGANLLEVEQARFQAASTLAAVL
jgi:hypothetical protein